MRSSDDLTRVQVTFDEPGLVPCAGLLPGAALAQRLDLSGLVDARLDLPKHGANSGIKALTVVGSMLGGGDSIDDTALLRAGPRSRTGCPPRKSPEPTSPRPPTPASPAPVRTCRYA